MNASIEDVIEGRARWCVVERDALAVLYVLPAGVVDAIITDPPYSSGGMFRGDRTQNVKTKYVLNGTESGSCDLPEFSGDSRDQRSFCYWCTLWMGEALRVCVPGGVLATFTDWRQLPTMTDALQCGGWIWRGVVPWVKRSYRPTMNRFSSQCEYVAWGTNGARALDGGPPLPGWYEGDPPRGDDREHITQKPLEVMRALCRIAPPQGLVLDPFAGSGTTAVAAVLEGRRAICFEVAPEHAETTRRRLAAAESGTDYRRPEQASLFAARAEIVQ
jgi:site-specific DNA-methyltransferase (adenine-specific)